MTGHAGKCGAWCTRCSAGNPQACKSLHAAPECAGECPPHNRKLGRYFDDPPLANSPADLSSALDHFVADHKQADKAAPAAYDRDEEVVSHAKLRAADREASIPVQFVNRVDVWGGGLRRMVDGGVGPRREDAHYYAPRYVPIGFARYVSPIIDPADYTYYQMSGWRVAVPRTVAGPEVRALLLRIYQYGPGSSGYARLGDTLVPAILGPGDRQTLAQSESRYGPITRKYPLA